jgi:MoaA/NifB/PqqE/SkfB family radical SAM enzyme
MDLATEIASGFGLVEKLAGLPVDPLPDTPILFAKVKLLWQCNLACEYCPPRPAAAPMPASRVASILAQLRARGLRKIHFSGGELLLHPEIDRILEDACGAGLQVNFTTNGTLLDGPRARRLAALGVHAITVSLDAADAATHDAARGRKGAHKAALRGIRALLRRGRKGPRVRVNTVVTRRNVAGLDALHALLRDLGGGIRWRLLPVDTLRADLRLSKAEARALHERARGWELLDRPPFEPVGGSPERHAARGEYGLGYYERHRCYIPWLHLFVDPEGFAHPCCAARAKLPALGSLAVGSVDDLLRGERSRAVRQSLAAGRPLEPCSRCDDFLAENRAIEALLAQRARRPGDAREGT